MTLPRATPLPRPLVVAAFAAPVAFLGVFYVWPLTTLLARSLNPAAIAEALGGGRTWRVVWFTLWQALASTGLTMLVGIGPARVFARFGFPGRRLLSAAMVAVFVLPSVVVAAAVLALLPASLQGSVVPILFAHVLFNLAVVVRTVGAVWEHLSDDMEHAAATLGAPALAVRREVTWPLLRPSIIAAGSIVFAFCFTSYGVIRILGDGRATIEVEVWRRAVQGGDVPVAAVLALLQLAVLGVVITTANRLQRRSTRSLALRTPTQRRRPRAGRERVLVAATATLTAVFVGAPLVALAERSLRVGGDHTLAPWRQLGDPPSRRGIRVGVEPIEAVLTSLRLAVVASVIAVVVGVAGALAVDMARRAGRLLDVGLMLPLVTSAVTVGFGILITFDHSPIDWRGSPWIVPIGHAMIGVPFVVRATLSVVRGLDPQLSLAAGTLGASPGRAWREVTLAHVRRPAVVGAGLAAAVSLGEFGATSVLSRSGSDTLPTAIAKLLDRSGGVLHAQGYALAVILAALTIVIAVLLDGAGHARRS